MQCFLTANSAVFSNVSSSRRFLTWWLDIVTVVGVIFHHGWFCHFSHFMPFVVSFNSDSQYVVKKRTSMVVPQPTALDLLGKNTNLFILWSLICSHSEWWLHCYSMFSLPETENWCFGRWTFLFKFSFMAYFHRVSGYFLAVPFQATVPLLSHVGFIASNGSSPVWSQLGKVKAGRFKSPNSCAAWKFHSSSDGWWPRWMGWWPGCGWLAVKISRGFLVYPFFGGFGISPNITKHAAFPTKQNSPQKKIAQITSIKKSNQKKTKFHFEKKTSAHLVFRILLPVPEKGTMWGVPSKYCIRDWKNLGRTPTSSPWYNVCENRPPYLCVCLCVLYNSV